MLRQLPAVILAEAADTVECKQVAADDETYIKKCPAGTPGRTTTIAEPSTTAAEAPPKHSPSPQGCKAGTTCAVVMPAVLSVVAALVAAAGGIWAACIRRRKKQAAATP
jgi:hypothetical protein